MKGMKKSLLDLLKAEALQKMSRPRVTFPNFKDIPTRPDQDVQLLETKRQADMFGRKVANQQVRDYMNTKPGAIKNPKPYHDENSKKISNRFDSKTLGLNYKTKDKNFDAALAGKLRSKHEPATEDHQAKLNTHKDAMNAARDKYNKELKSWYETSQTLPQGSTAFYNHWATKPEYKKPRAPAKKGRKTTDLNPAEMKTRGQGVESTVEHEGFHSVMDHIERKHGKDAAIRVQDAMENMHDPETWGHVSDWIEKTRGYKRNSESFGEETLAHTRDILVNAQKREHFVKFMQGKLGAGRDSEIKRHINNLKQGHQKVYNYAQKLKPEDVVSQKMAASEHSGVSGQLNKAGTKTPSKNIPLARLKQIKQDNNVGANGVDYTESELNEAINERKISQANKMVSGAANKEKQMAREAQDTRAPSFPPAMPMKKVEPKNPNEAHPNNPWIAIHNTHGQLQWHANQQQAQNIDNHLSKPESTDKLLSLVPDSHKGAFHSLIKQTLSDPNRHFIPTAEKGREKLRARHIRALLMGNHDIRIDSSTPNVLKVIRDSHSNQKQYPSIALAYKFGDQNANGVKKTERDVGRGLAKSLQAIYAGTRIKPSIHTGRNGLHLAKSGPSTPKRNLTRNQKIEEVMMKSFSSKHILPIAATLAFAMPTSHIESKPPQKQTQVQQKPKIDKAKLLQAIAQVESRGGQDTNHKPTSQGTAHGVYGLMPNTIKEVVAKHPDFKSHKRVLSLENNQIHSYMDKNPNLQHQIAAAYLGRIHDRFDGDLGKTIHSWLNGVSGTLRKDPKAIDSHWYVQRVKKQYNEGK